MKSQKERDLMKKKIDDKIESYKVFAQILQGFFLKAIVAENLFDEHLSFKAEFEQVENYVATNFLYPPMDIYQETKMKNIFSPGDSTKKLQIGIKMAMKVFELYKLFKNFP